MRTQYIFFITKQKQIRQNTKNKDAKLKRLDVVRKILKNILQIKLNPARNDFTIMYVIKMLSQQILAHYT